jgi:hypothetical protein
LFFSVFSGWCFFSLGLDFERQRYDFKTYLCRVEIADINGDENADISGGENAAGVHKQGERTESDREPGGKKSGGENAGFGGGENAAGVHIQEVKTET